MRIFDSHAHYIDKSFDIDRDTLIRKMYDNGIKGIIALGDNEKNIEPNIHFVEKYNFMYAANGIYPGDIHENLDLALLYRLSQNKKVVAIGEIRIRLPLQTF